MWARFGSPGPKFTAGTPSAEKRATSVQPCFASTGRPSASTNARAAGRCSPGRAPPALSTTSTSKPANTSRTCASASASTAVGGVAVVDGDHAPVGDDVRRHAPGDEHRVERLAELEPVDAPRHRLRRRRAARRTLGRVVDRVVALPRPRGVGGDALGRHLGPQRPLAAPLDAGVRRLEEHGEVGVGDQLGALLLDVQQAVVPGVDLLAPRRTRRSRRGSARGSSCGDPEHDRDPALHVDRAAAPEHLAPGGVHAAASAG